MIDSAGEWTAPQIYGILLENALDLDVIGPNLTITVQDTKPSVTATSAATSGGVYTGFSAAMSLKGVSSSFATAPDAILAHEYGHVWAEYHRFLSQQGDWSAWLDFRGLAGDPRLDTTYPWNKLEMIAEDYRLLFSSPVVGRTGVPDRPVGGRSGISAPVGRPGLWREIEPLDEVWSGNAHGRDR